MEKERSSLQQVVIVGGGISGLSAAYFLEKHAAEEGGKDLSIHLMERRDRLGGVILTERTDGFLLEGGPDCFLTQKPAALELCRALGLADQLIPSNDDQRKTYILQSGKLKELPDGLMFLLPTKVWPVLRSDLFSLPGKIRLAVSPLLPPPRRQEDVSVADFVTERLGKEMLERLAEPLISAVYGADVDSLSAGAILQRLIALEEKYGSLWKAVRRARRAPPTKQAGPGSGLFASLREGVGQIVGSLGKSLARTQVIQGREIKKISRMSNGCGFRIQWGDGETDAKAVIVATPAHASAGILEELDPRLAEKLREIPYHSTVTVSLGFEKESFGRTLDGFGFVVPRQEGKRLVACTWVSTKFPFRCPPGHVLLRGFLGGAKDPSVIGESDDWILQTVLRELGEIMGIRSAPTFFRIHRWKDSMPQYRVGHPRRLREINGMLAAQPGLFLAGNAYGGIGIPDCIESSSLAAAAAYSYLGPHS
jgi:oxygen-dependent protoporphyrinogen oxidase